MSQLICNHQDEFTECLILGSRKMGFCLTRDQQEKMCRYAKELIIWNQKMNLTAIRTIKEMAEKHFLDSLMPLQHVAGAQSLVDLGTGAGFPGIVLKIMNPDLTVTLVDASRKKVNFLKQVIRVLNLEKINAVHERIENFNTSAQHKKQYDIVISRAFAGLKEFSALAVPLLAENGRVLAMKNARLDEPGMESLKRTFEIASSFYRLPFDGSRRCILTFSQT